MYADDTRKEFTTIAPFLRYFIPTRMLFDYLTYDLSIIVAYCMAAFVFIVAFIIAALVATRDTKELSTDSPERKIVNKTVGLVISITYYLLFVPVSTFSSNFLYCHPRSTSACF